MEDGWGMPNMHMSELTKGLLELELLLGKIAVASQWEWCLMNDIMCIHFHHGDGFNMSFNVHGMGMGHGRGELLFLSYMWHVSPKINYLINNIWYFPSQNPKSKTTLFMS